jgi:hypothetical protein
MYVYFNLYIIQQKMGRQKILDGMVEGILDGMAVGILDGMVVGILDGMAVGILDGMAVDIPKFNLFLISSFIQF